MCHHIYQKSWKNVGHRLTLFLIEITIVWVSIHTNVAYIRCQLQCCTNYAVKIKRNFPKMWSLFLTKIYKIKSCFEYVDRFFISYTNHILLTRQKFIIHHMNRINHIQTKIVNRFKVPVGIFHTINCEWNRMYC